MIKSKKDLQEYLEADKKNLGFGKKDLPIVGKEIWKFQISLRYLEYYTNVPSLVGETVRKLG